MNLDTRGSTFLRVLTALVLIPLALGMIWLPMLGPFFVLFIAALAAIGMIEFYQMALNRGMTPELTVGTVAGTATVLSAYFNNTAIVSLVFFAGAALIAWLHILQGNHSLPGLCASIFGMVYVGLLPTHFVLLHGTPLVGPGLVTMLIAAVALSDTGAYFTGRFIGRHKLAPRVSPKKTWEGAIGGTGWAVAGMAVAWWLNSYFQLESLPDWGLMRYVLTGLALAIVGQIGDLAESMMKRDAGIKDSGNIFPGHGGVLDRCDGFLFAGPVLYYMIAF